MSVTNRKMFRSRNARNKLNQMGGIMASSPELMGTVQRYNVGGPVRIPIQALADVTGRGFTLPTSGNMPVPYNPGFTTPGGTGGPPINQGPTSRAQRDPSRPVPSNKSLVPMTGAQGPQDPPSRLQGIQQFLKPAGRFLSRTPLLSAVYGAGRAVADPLDVDSVDAFEPRSVMGIDPSKRRDREFFLEDFEAMSEEQQQRALEAENASRSASRSLAMAGRVAGTIADPILELGQDVLNMDVTERRLETAAAEAQERNRPLTMEEYKLSLLSKDPERNKRIINDRRERVGPSEMPQNTASTQGTAADVAKTEKLAEELFGGELKTTVDKKTSGTTKKTDAVADLPSTVDPKKIESDPEAATDFGSKIVATASQFLGSDANETEKNDLLLELTGRKDPESKLTMKERYKENLELYREVFGESPEQDKKIDGYNLAMLGFLIASGDSPNALQNIAKGAAAGVDRIQKTAEARQAREEKLKFAALQRASSQQDAEIERETKWAQTLFKDSRDAKRAQKQMAFDLAKLNIELEEKRELANDKAASDQARADANNRADQLRTMINNYGELGNLAATQLMTEGFDPESIFTQEGFKKLTDTMEDLAKRFPQISATSQKSQDPGLTRPAYIRNVQDEFRTNPETQDFYSERLGKDVSEITAADIAAEAGREYDLGEGGGTSGTPAPAQSSSQFSLGQIITQGPNRFRVTGIDPNGNPITEPVQ